MTRRQLPVLAARLHSEISRADRSVALASAAMRKQDAEERTDAQLALVCTFLHSFYNVGGRHGSGTGAQRSASTVRWAWPRLWLAT
jgi:hypothetical protein